MSEADSPNDQSGLPTPTEPAELSAADSAAEMSSPDSSEDWQTIPFPRAMSVDAIPPSLTESVKQPLEDGVSASASLGMVYYSSAEIDRTTPSFAIAAATDDTPSRQQLEDENAALHDRLAQVELDLVQQQIEWQLESARTQAQSETTEAVSTSAAGAIAQSTTLEQADKRLNQLLQELERSHQTAQRQQILVETLTDQLESSQERVAQLERDCALTQQRYNEQVQQVLQAEGTCRDLRLRLHRQQQQTLQFKAALEKCLEMPTAYGQQVMPDVAIDDNAATPDALAALLKPKNQPVKPWSVPPRAASESECDQSELPKPLFKLLSGLSVQGDESSGLQGNTFPTPADPSALLDSDDPEFVTQLMQLIFPNPVEQQTYTTTDALQAAPVFDLSPFLGTEPVPTDTLPSVESKEGRLVSHERSTDGETSPLGAIQATGFQQEDTAPAKVPPSARHDDRSTDPLWDHLAALIDPPSTVEGMVVASVPEPAQLDNATETDNASDSTVEPIAAWTWRDRLANAAKTPRATVQANTLPEKALPEKAAESPAKLLALSSVGRQTSANQKAATSQQTVNVSNLTQPMFSPVVAPSPIVYPLHYTKKLASLAAVDLPTFPRR